LYVCLEYNCLCLQVNPIVGNLNFLLYDWKREVNHPLIKTPLKNIQLILYMYINVLLQVLNQMSWINVFPFSLMSKMDWFLSIDHVHIHLCIYKMSWNFFLGVLINGWLTSLFQSYNKKFKCPTIGFTCKHVLVEFSEKIMMLMFTQHQNQV
jgi:hypothetical protein